MVTHSELQIVAELLFQKEIFIQICKLILLNDVCNKICEMLPEKKMHE